MAASRVFAGGILHVPLASSAGWWAAVGGSLAPASSLMGGEVVVRLRLYSLSVALPWGMHQDLGVGFSP